MTTFYPIVPVAPLQRIEEEPLGSKKKFWVIRDGEPWLFKFARDNTGEDWTEKVAAEIAALLGISAAQVDLAEFDGRPGCLCRSFVNEASGEALVHGNEVLAGKFPEYESGRKFRQKMHTFSNVLEALRLVFPNETQLAGVLKTFAEQLVLDALIGNTDRHHENWGLLKTANGYVAAPSFDHASSLGRELLEPAIEKLLSANTVGGYVRKGRGGIYIDSNASKGENPLALVEKLSQKYPHFFKDPLVRVAQLKMVEVKRIIEDVPSSRASESGKEFGARMVDYAQPELCKLLK